MDTNKVKRLSLLIDLSNNIVWHSAMKADLDGVDKAEMQEGIKVQITEISALLVELAGEVE